MSTWWSSSAWCDYSWNCANNRSLPGPLTTGHNHSLQRHPTPPQVLTIVCLLILFACLLKLCLQSLIINYECRRQERLQRRNISFIRRRFAQQLTTVTDSSHSPAVSTTTTNYQPNGLEIPDSVRTLHQLGPPPTYEEATGQRPVICK